MDMPDMHDSAQNIIPFATSCRWSAPGIVVEMGEPGWDQGYFEQAWASTRCCLDYIILHLVLLELQKVKLLWCSFFACCFSDFSDWNSLFNPANLVPHGPTLGGEQPQVANDFCISWERKTCATPNRIGSLSGESTLKKHVLHGIAVI